MITLRAVWSFSRRRRIVLFAGLLLGVVYSSSWSFRRELGLVRPMANLRYFCFGAEPDSSSDRALYWLYYPAYRPYLAYQMVRHGERYDVHWSDRREPVLPTPVELGMKDADYQ